MLHAYTSCFIISLCNHFILVYAKASDKGEDDANSCGDCYKEKLENSNAKYCSERGKQHVKYLSSLYRFRSIFIYLGTFVMYI